MPTKIQKKTSQKEADERRKNDLPYYIRGNESMFPLYDFSCIKPSMSSN